MKNLHSGDGPPCRNMEDLLQGVADGSLNGIRKWYAVAHASKCSHCGTFLDRLSETLGKLHQARSTVAPPSDALERLKQGSWREVAPREKEV